ncbi:MAG: WYL domain-containing protein [Deltaproteobacteria bacterium]|jgi:predicted DNA-binding transcriptional regulator YafY|nr:WYL domain-containing protein [Deltaproteobacteria bacterium]
MPEKHDPAKPAEKILSLYTILMGSRRSLSLAELKGKLNCSGQTLSRLIGQLESSRIGKVVREMRGREAFFRLDRPSGLPRVALNPEGLRELALCRDFLRHLLPDAIRKNMDTALLQAASMVREGTDPGLDASLGRSMFKGRIDYGPYGEILETLIEAISGQRICVVSYRPSLGAEARRHDFAPKQLTVFHEAIYVEGWMVSKANEARFEDHNTLAVHRLISVDITCRDGSRLPPLPPAGNGFGVMPGEPFIAKVKFDARVATYVAEREWDPDQRKTSLPDGSLILAFHVNGLDEAISWILGFGDAAEVRSPKWLRKAVADKISDMAARYAASSDGLGDSEQPE